tara:strand:- start:100 stop:648 length:549 start_codon:yes stop_codon:yes gene_type:complete
MNQVSEVTNTAKTATRVAKPETKLTIHEIVAVIGKGEKSEKAAKAKSRGFQIQRGPATLALTALNTGKTHYGLNKAVSGALDQAVEGGVISKRLVTQLCSVIKSDHVVSVVAAEGDHIEIIKDFMAVKSDKPLTWRALLDFAEHGGPKPEIDPVAALIEAFENLLDDQAERVIAYFKEEFPS